LINLSIIGRFVLRPFLFGVCSSLSASSAAAAAFASAAAAAALVLALVATP
jgi:hypothetical protein